jgi:hypothetical protein
MSANFVLGTAYILAAPPRLGLGEKSTVMCCTRESKLRADRPPRTRRNGRLRTSFPLAALASFSARSSVGVGRGGNVGGAALASMTDSTVCRNAHGVYLVTSKPKPISAASTRSSTAPGTVSMIANFISPFAAANIFSSAG